MKTIFTRSAFTKSICCSLLAFGVLTSHSLYTNDDPVDGKKKKKESKGSEAHALNNKSVKIYPDPIKREMHIVSKENTESTFFVFDIEGTMVVNRLLKENEHFKVSGLKRGLYTFHLFIGDEEKATGKFEIR